MHDTFFTLLMEPVIWAPSVLHAVGSNVCYVSGW